MSSSRIGSGPRSAARRPGAGVGAIGRVRQLDWAENSRGEPWFIAVVEFVDGVETCIGFPRRCADPRNGHVQAGDVLWLVGRVTDAPAGPEIHLRTWGWAA